MANPTWQIAAVVVLVLLLLAIVVIVGLKRRKAKMVSFGDDDDDAVEQGETKQLTQEQKSGNYQAHGGFNFAPAVKQPHSNAPAAAAAGTTAAAAAVPDTAAGTGREADTAEADTGRHAAHGGQTTPSTTIGAGEDATAPARHAKPETTPPDDGTADDTAGDNGNDDGDSEHTPSRARLGMGNLTDEEIERRSAESEANIRQREAERRAKAEEEARKKQREEEDKDDTLVASSYHSAVTEADESDDRDESPLTAPEIPVDDLDDEPGSIFSQLAHNKGGMSVGSYPAPAKKTPGPDSRDNDPLTADLSTLHLDDDLTTPQSPEPAGDKTPPAEADPHTEVSGDAEAGQDGTNQTTPAADTDDAAEGDRPHRVNAEGDAKSDKAQPVAESGADTPDTPAADTAVDSQTAATDDTAEPETTDQAEAEAEATEAAAAAAAAAEKAGDAKQQTPAPVGPTPAAQTAAEAQAAARGDIAPAKGRLGKLRGRLARSQNVIGQGVLGILSAGDLDEDAWEEIEDTLLMADLGTATTMRVVDKLRDTIAERGVSSEADARAMLRETLIDACKPEMDRSIRAMPNDGKPAVILMVGVNGTGKTTTTGKLARVLVSMGHTVLLGAADTFRAAAVDQLDTWGRRVGAETVRGEEGADPASVAFDAVAKGVEDGLDVVLIDTAGRLHTSTSLMDQLGKVKRVVEKKTHVDEVLLVLDATVGQNGVNQARIFRDVVDITGVVLTKLDGTAKGGIVFQVQEELGVPVKLVGLGEGADHLAPFEPESFVDALLG
ncbi:signal recognition particle-docking protein FtsY [Corynebacterium sp. CCM 8862]|uniref:Signal recognition particle receptor FtsY n=2 Tax=Corynebacterium mendelii TaxID=2765362 RepID=A0A939DXR1_9CORY|nr:signal recognition particle-docking protein FtsY [Corynebacterium mendelii]